ncbi:MAG TPA: response regulator [Anaerolineaceae bacterium]|nr:response regulator [Anaerolineaceae bacterium]
MTDTPVDILLVEDNPNDVELTIHALKSFCPINRIQVARDGVEALEYTFCTGKYMHRSPTIQPRMILLDLKLPRVDGIQVLKRVKSDPRTQGIPVIVLTSSSDEGDVEESYRLGANSYIIKPVDFAEFTHAARILGAYWLELNRSIGM